MSLRSGVKSKKEQIDKRRQGNHSFNPIEEGALALKKSQDRGPAIDVVFVDGKLHCVYASGAT